MEGWGGYWFFWREAAEQGKRLERISAAPVPGLPSPSGDHLTQVAARLMRRMTSEGSQVSLPSFFTGVHT